MFIRDTYVRLLHGPALTVDFGFNGNSVGNTEIEYDKIIIIILFYK
jgi:hypothetical protein